jgi:hypothetical protein
MEQQQEAEHSGPARTRLEQWMRDRGIEPAVLARVFGVQPATVHGWMGGRVPGDRHRLALQLLSDDFVGSGAWR